MSLINIQYPLYLSAHREFPSRFACITVHSLQCTHKSLSDKASPSSARCASVFSPPINFEAIIHLGCQINFLKSNAVQRKSHLEQSKKKVKKTDYPKSGHSESITTLRENFGPFLIILGIFGEFLAIFFLGSH